MGTCAGRKESESEREWGRGGGRVSGGYKHRECKRKEHTHGIHTYIHTYLDEVRAVVPPASDEAARAGVKPGVLPAVCMRMRRPLVAHNLLAARAGAGQSVSAFVFLPLHLHDAL